MKSVMVYFNDGKFTEVNDFQSFFDIEGNVIDTPLHYGAVVVIKGTNHEVQIHSSDIHHIEIY